MTRAEAIDAAAHATSEALTRELVTHDGDPADFIGSEGVRRLNAAHAALDAALTLPPDPAPSVSEREQALVTRAVEVASGGNVIGLIAAVDRTHPRPPEPASAVASIVRELRAIGEGMRRLPDVHVPPSVIKNTRDELRSIADRIEREWGKP